MNLTPARLLMGTGALITFAGLFAVKSAFELDTTVFSPSTSFSSSSSVYNTGLQQDQMMKMIFAVTLMLVGSVLGSAGFIVEFVAPGNNPVLRTQITELTPEEIFEIEEQDAHRRRVASWMLAVAIVVSVALYIASSEGLI